MIVGISGKIASGKNTVANMMTTMVARFLGEKVGWLGITNADLYAYPSSPTICNGWQIKMFADKLKQVVALITGCEKSQLESQDFKTSFLPSEWKYLYKSFEKFSTTVLQAQYREEIRTIYERTPEFAPFPEDKIAYFQASREAIRGAGWKKVMTEDDMWVKDKVEDKVYTYRQALQLIGTDLFRMKFHDNVWVNALFADYHPTVDQTGGIVRSANAAEVDTDKWIIADVRFENEARAIKDRKGILIRINRPFITSWHIDDSNTLRTFIGDKAHVHFSNVFTKDQAEKLVAEETEVLKAVNHHASEVALDAYEQWDYVIDNNGSLVDLEFKVKDILVKEQIIR